MKKKNDPRSDDLLVQYQCGKRTAVNSQELAQTSTILAAVLQRNGIGQGSRVLCLLPPSISLYSHLLALFTLKATVITASPAGGLKELLRCSLRAAPEYVLATRPIAALFRLLKILYSERSAPRQIQYIFPIQAIKNSKLLETSKGTPELIHGCLSTPNETPLLISWTTGTSGQSKALVRRAQDFAMQQQTLTQLYAYAAHKIELSGQPLFVLNNLAIGMRSVLSRAKESSKGKRLFQRLLQEGCDRFAASPSMIEAVCDYCQKTGQTLPQLQEIYTGGAPIWPKLLRKISKCFPSVLLKIIYGSSEAQPICMIDADQLKATYQAMEAGCGLCVGHPVPGLALRLEGDYGPVPAATRAARETKTHCGEILVQAAHVNSRYFDIPDAENPCRFSAEDGSQWHRSGDIGYLDEEGQLWLVGRTALCIHTAQGILHPYPIEGAALRHSAIQRAALIPGPRNGELLLLVQLKRNEPASNTKLSPRAGSALRTGRLSHAMLKTELRELLFPLLRLEQAAVLHIKILHRIPVDPRHRYRNDYAALKRRFLHE